MPFCFDIKTIILPRQARDKHRESTQNRDAVSQGRGYGCVVSGLHAALQGKKTLLFGAI
jgi:hypothetical protein